MAAVASYVGGETCARRKLTAFFLRAADGECGTSTITAEHDLKSGAFGRIHVARADQAMIQSSKKTTTPAIAVAIINACGTVLDEISKL